MKTLTRRGVEVVEGRFLGDLRPFLTFLVAMVELTDAGDWLTLDVKWGGDVSDVDMG